MAELLVGIQLSNQRGHGFNNLIYVVYHYSRAKRASANFGLYG